MSNHSLPFRDTPHGRIWALDVLPSGRTVWPAMGGSKDDPKDDPEKPEDEPEDDPDDDPKDDPKKKDDPEDDDPKDDDTKAQSRKWEGRAKANKKEADDAKAKLNAVLAALGGKDASKQDPKEMATQLDALRAGAAEATRENAVLRVSGSLGVDGDKLVDSKSFMAKIGTIDIEDEDYRDKVKAAVKAFTKDRPEYEVSTTSKKSATRSGSAVSGKGTAGQLTEADLESMTPAEIVKAQAEGRCNEIMGIKTK